jgi:hypothetical protein
MRKLIIETDPKLTEPNSFLNFLNIFCYLFQFKIKKKSQSKPYYINLNQTKPFKKNLLKTKGML